MGASRRPSPHVADDLAAPARLRRRASPCRCSTSQHLPTLSLLARRTITWFPHPRGMATEQGLYSSCCTQADRPLRRQPLPFRAERSHKVVRRGVEPRNIRFRGYRWPSGARERRGAGRGGDGAPGEGTTGDGATGAGPYATRRSRAYPALDGPCPAAVGGALDHPGFEVRVAVAGGDPDHPAL